MTTVALHASEDLSCDRTNQYNVARAKLETGTFYCYARNDALAKDFLDSARDMFEQLGCWASASECLYWLARTEAIEALNYMLALNLSQRALLLAEQLGDAYLIAQALENIGCYHLFLGNLDNAESTLRRHLSRSQEFGQLLEMAQALDYLGYLHAMKGNLSKAAHFYMESESQYGKVTTSSMG